jgi:hypothetical protein
MKWYGTLWSVVGLKQGFEPESFMLFIKLFIRLGLLHVQW